MTRLHWGARHAFFTSGLTIEQVLTCYNSASPAAPLLIQQGHYVVRVTCPALVLPGRRARFLPRRARTGCMRRKVRPSDINCRNRQTAQRASRRRHAPGARALARGAAARLERRAPRGPPRGVVRLGPTTGVCARQTTHAGASSSRVAGGGLCRCGRGRCLGGGWLRRHLHAFCSTHA